MKTTKNYKFELSPNQIKNLENKGLIEREQKALDLMLLKQGILFITCMYVVCMFIVVLSYAFSN